MCLTGPSTVRRTRCGFRPRRGISSPSCAGLGGLGLDAQGVQKGHEIRLHPLVQALGERVHDGVARRTLLLEGPTGDQRRVIDLHWSSCLGYVEYKVIVERHSAGRREDRYWRG